jgi:hypothetical protein
MPSDPVQAFWNSAFAQVQDRVSKRNEESAPHLKFERIPNGFKVCRESPFLVVERWLADNRIHGRSATKDKSGREMHTLFVPLTITGENEASFPPDPVGKSVPLTTDETRGRNPGTDGTFPDFSEPGPPLRSLQGCEPLTSDL